MYVPPAFSVEDRAWAIGLIRRYPFGLLVTAQTEYPHVTHLPMLAEEREGDLWILGHVARANDHARAIDANAAATAVFEGPHAYVSAGWYEDPQHSVPTWNYAAVHCCGRLHSADAPRVLELLTRALEGEENPAWEFERIDANYRKAQLRGIVAFELRVERLYAKAKLSQNRSNADRQRVIDRLARSRYEDERECAKLMHAALGEDT